MVEPEKRLFRSVCMRFSYLAVDLPHLMYSVKEAARAMAAPSRGALAKLKRVGRYLEGRPRVAQFFFEQDEVQALKPYTDSDYAGDLLERKSTTSVFLMRGDHLIRGSSSTQTIQGLSVGECEFMAMVRGCSIGLGAKAMSADLGYCHEVVVPTDSSTARGIGLRRGVGKIRHLHTPLLWVQRRIRRGDLRLEAVKGSTNIADLGTKPLAGPKLEEILYRCGFRFMSGQSSLALKASL